jgi:transcriptional regulator
MLVHPWDAAVDEEWRTWLAEGRDFGQLIAGGRDDWPVVVPTHFLLDDDRVWLHLARPNPVWPAIEAQSRVTLSVLDDYAYIPTTWRAPAGTAPANGVPTSYYATVQLRCTATILDDPAAKADVLRRQLAALQPAGDYGAVEVDGGPYHRMLAGIRALRLDIVEVTAKFKFDDHKPAEHRRTVATRLHQRAQGRDLHAGEQQLRRISQRSAD